MNRVSLIFLIAAGLGLMVWIDGLLKGELLRAFLGGSACLLFAWMAFWGVPYLSAKLDRKFAEQMDTMGQKRNWVFAIASVLFALMFFAFAIASLVAPFEYIVDWGRRTSGLVTGLESLVGQVGTRFLLAALFLFVGGAAAMGAWTWFSPVKDRPLPRKKGKP